MRAGAVFLLVLVGTLGCGDGSRRDARGTSGAGGAAGHDGTGRAANGGSGGVGGAAGSQSSGSPGQVDACGPVLRQPRCLTGEWCWDGPGVLGGDLFAIDGTADAKSVWAVGTHGSAFRFCGGRWLPIETGVEAHLYAVFSPSADFAVAVGEQGTVIVWNGRAWKRVAMPTELSLHAVWGASASDMWIGARTRTIDRAAETLFRFDGEAVTEAVATGGSIWGLRGRSSSDVYAVGSDGLAPRSDHYDGKTWAMAWFVSTTDAGQLRQLVYGAKNRAYALFDGLSVGLLFADDRPTWRAVFEKSPLAALYLDDLRAPSAVAASQDPLMPGVVFKENPDNRNQWQMAADRFTVLPAAVWTGAGKGFAVARGLSLLERGADGVWAQTPDFAAMLGDPLFFGGVSDDNAYFVSEHDIHQRDAGGWRALPRSAARIVAASQDAAGDLYVATDDGMLRAYDGRTWRELPSNARGVLDQLFAFAPDDLWQANQTTGYHFDGTAWTAVRTLCSADYGDEPTAFRRAPGGKVWGVNDRLAVEIDPAARACKQVVRMDPDSADADPLVDVAWTDNGAMWALSRGGKLYRRTAAAFELQAAPGLDAGRELRATALKSAPGSNILRYLLETRISGDDRHRSTSRLVTVDVSGAAPSPEVEELAVAGPLWLPNATDTLIASSGGVLRRPAVQAGPPHELPPARPEDNTSASPAVPSGTGDGPPLFCESATLPGQAVVVPCITSLSLSKAVGVPPGGSRCNGSSLYDLDAVTNTFSWLRCVVSDDPITPWGAETGSKQLTEAELSALLAKLQVATVTAATECRSDTKPTAELIVVTRTAVTPYGDSDYACGVDEIFVDNLDAVLETLDTLAR